MFKKKNSLKVVVFWKQLRVSVHVLYGLFSSKNKMSY